MKLDHDAEGPVVIKPGLIPKVIDPEGKLTLTGPPSSAEPTHIARCPGQGATCVTNVISLHTCRSGRPRPNG